MCMELSLYMSHAHLKRIIIYFFETQQWETQFNDL